GRLPVCSGAICRSHAPGQDPRPLAGREGPGLRGRDRGPARGLSPARDGPFERRAVHRPPLTPEARHGPKEARQMAERAAEEGGLNADALRRDPAVRGTFPAHLSAQLAMLLIVLLAFGGALVA